MSSAEVERCELAPGFSISRLLVGLWQIADMEREGNVLDADETALAMLPYVEEGLTTFDMADHYGSAEEICGAYSARFPTTAVEFLTKWVPEPGASSKDEVRTAVERALRRLRADRIDLLQFHAWNYADPSWLDLLFWLQELKEEGLIRHLGLTNVDTAHLRIVLHSGIDVVSNQVCYSLLDRRPSGAMTDLCLAHGVKLLCYGTVAGGLLTERWLGAADPGLEGLTWSQMKYRRFIEEAGGWEVHQRLLSAVQRVGERRGVSMANVACRYVLEQPAVGGIIIGARLGESEHVADNVRLMDWSLDDQDRSELAAATERLAAIPGGPGDEYRKPPYLTASGDLSHHLEALPLPYAPEPVSRARAHVTSGTVWEDLAGFSRAVRHGDRIYVSGTTATQGVRGIGGSDPEAQMHFIIDKIEGALQSLGGRLEDVVRTRLFIHDPGDWEPVSRAHGQRFAHVRPANTLVRAGLIGDGYLVEMEAEAVVSSGSGGEGA